MKENKGKGVRSLRERRGKGGRRVKERIARKEEVEKKGKGVRERGGLRERRVEGRPEEDDKGRREVGG